MRNKLHLWFLGILVIVFVAVLFMSTAFKNINETYSFEDNINVVSTSRGLDIGNVEVENNGFLPAKAFLKDVRACVFDDSFDQVDMYLSYKGADSQYFDGETSYYLEVFPGKSDRAVLSVEYLPVKAVKVGENYSALNNFNLYLFEVERSTQIYGFCDGADKNDAFKVIEVNVEN